MKNKISQKIGKGKSLIGGIVLMALLAFVLMLQINGALAQDGPSRVDSPQVFASTGALNFQGELTDNSSGSAIPDGSYNMRFAIYDASTGGNKKWPLSNAYESQTGVAVSGGLFNAQLGVIDPITPGVFAGGGDRYLQIWVCTSAGAGCTTYDDLGRLPISSAAYAQNLAAGSSIEGSSNSLLSLYGSDSSGSVLTVNSTATTGNASGVYGTSTSSSGSGISGYNGGGGYGVYGGSTSGYGVYGSSTSGAGVAGVSSLTGVAGVADDSGGRGVYGSSIATSGTAYGVYGSAFSSNSEGIGVYGTASFTGTVGIATAASGTTYGVYGTSASTSGIGIEGYATALSGQTTGVLGVSDSPNGTGVQGVARSSTGGNYGVYGQSNSPDGFGVYSQGNVFVQGTLTTTGVIEARGNVVVQNPAAPTETLKLQSNGIVFPDGTTQTTAHPLGYIGESGSALDFGSGWYGGGDVTIGADGLPIVAYFEESYGDTSLGLKVKHCTDISCRSASPAALIDSGNVGFYPSIAVGGDGLPDISYYDIANGDLKLANCTNMACTNATITTPDSAGDVGRFSSIATGPSGYSIISYYDDTNGDLKVVSCTNQACTSPTITTLDSTNDVGLHTSLAIGADGLPIIAYYRYVAASPADGYLKVAHCDNETCSTATITEIERSGMEAGHNIDLAIGIDGIPMIAYVKLVGTDPNLRLARCSNLSCTGTSITNLDSGLFSNDGIAMAIGSDGFPILSYNKYPGGESFSWEFLHCSDIQCSVRTSYGTEHNFAGTWAPDLTIGIDGMPIELSVGSLGRCSNRFCVPYARP